MGALLPSSKKMGKYESHLLRILTTYFEDKGFEVFSHVQLNIAWGNIISDVDLVAMREDQLIGVEVKSRKDKFKHAFEQIDRIRDFFDILYIASDKPKRFLEKNWQDDTVGLLQLKDGIVWEIEDGKLLSDKPQHSTLLMLRKVCLSRLAQAINCNCTGNKNPLAYDILQKIEGQHLKLILKSIVICDRTCETNCPIWNIEKRLITPLRNIERIVGTYNEPQLTPPLILAKTKEKKKSK